jgi:organic radical activating enzyme
MTKAKDDDRILIEKGLLLPLVEEFYTLQGEGFHTGKAAYFIRLGGCDISCNWCDTKFSWEASLHPLVKINDIIKKALKCNAKSIVITGGEPSQYNLSPLCSELKKNSFEIFIETSGTFKLSGQFDWICLSPKKHKPPLTEYYSIANELKVIIYDNSDFEWAQINAAKVNNNCHLFLQPEWSRYKTIINEIVEFIKLNPQWRISLQSHKFMNIP